MPWYKFAAVHRSGHATVEYLWLQERLLPEDRKAEWRNWTEWRELEDVAGNVVLVRQLPEKVRRTKIKEYRKQAAHARKMLAVLEKGGKS